MEGLPSWRGRPSASANRQVRVIHVRHQRFRFHQGVAFQVASDAPGCKSIECAVDLLQTRHLIIRRTPMITPPSLALFASQLVGLELDDGWKIDKQYDLPDDYTGGNFSLLYEAENASGDRGFVKVLNLHEVFWSNDAIKEIQKLSERYMFERRLVERCRTGNLSRVVKAFGHGQTRCDEWAPFPVSYIIFELAKHDIRQALDLSKNIDLATKLRYAHNAASGAAQLHTLGIAHQDIKPSNLLIIPNGGGSKLTDLGRASDRNLASWHDEYAIPGDSTYVPPEHLYRATPDGFDRRRIASDVYQIGNITAFILTGSSINQRLHIKLDPAHHWNNWHDSYSQVLPYVQDAHAAAIRDINLEIGGELSDEISTLIKCLTDPDIDHRGHPSSRRFRQPYAMNRVVTDLDRLSRRAELIAVGG